MNGNMGQLIGDVLLVLFTFFGVVPVLLNTVSQFTVLKRFAEEMVNEGVIAEQKVKDLLPKQQIAGAGIPFVLGLFKYRNIIEFNSLTVKRFQNNFKGEYDERKLKKYIESHF